MQPSLLRTPLFELHQEAGARFVDFAGWQMPVQYQGILQEHQAVRGHVGLFDVSHMGQLEVRGEGALAALNGLITNDLERIVDGQALYACLCREDGGVLDDLIVYRFSAEHLFICCNASNREKVVAWCTQRLAGAAPQLEVRDRTLDYGLLAVQGPAAVALVAQLAEVGFDPREIKRFRFARGRIAGVEAIVSRTGYTGEDGFELYLPAEQTAEVWRALRQADPQLVPVGLGARDTLRMEYKLALYGHELSEEINPLEAGLGWAVKLQKADFVGKAALEKIKAEGVGRRLVALRLHGRAIARQGDAIVDEAGAQIGVVTSGAPSPSLGAPIALAFVPEGLHAPQTPLRVQIRKRVEQATVVKPPMIPSNPDAQIER